MTKTQKLQLRASELRAELDKLAVLDSPTPEQLTDMDDKGKELDTVEVQYRAALRAEPDAVITQTGDVDPETRERLELRGKTLLTNYLLARAQGRLVSGVEAEFNAATGTEPGDIPVDLYGMSSELRSPELRADTATPAPGTVGINLDPIFPLIFARAVLPRVNVAMPSIPSGTYATATWTTALSAAAKAKGVAQESTAGAMTPVSSGSHRVSARLSLRLEDIADIGVANFESSARQQLMLAMSAELDRLGLLGDPAVTTDEPQGLLSQLTDPADATTVIDYDGFVALAANAIDGGPWAEGLGDVKLLVNADTMKLAERTFQSATSYKGEYSAAACLREKSGGFFSSSRMPATASTIAQVLRVRAMTMGLEGVNAMRLATCGVYDNVSIDDIYSDSGSAIRHFTMHSLITDVLLQQPDAFQRVDIKLA